MNKTAIVAVAWNCVFAVGGCSCAYGLWLAWHPLGFIGGGLAVALLGFGGGFEQARRKGRGR